MSEHKAPEWVGRAVQLYEAGYSLSQIAPIVNRSPTAVRNQLKRVGVELRSREEGIRLRYRPLSWVNEAIKLHREGYSPNQIARKVGKDPSTVRKQLKRAGFTLRTYHEDKSWGERAIKLYQSGYSLSQIASKTGKGHETVRYRLQREGVELRSKKKGSACVLGVIMVR